ncbi:uncharacterized protein LOC112557084 [Pomacea canaliculata]|uniref:uncharacterized protein LOC112557084 n=1 Tax=Pomacea canaliculata TaxID=400727 RepID=UPI000D7389A7|nr:uncharacterized protein LOC112557084 [Pomacea canaliculata]
MCRWGCPTTNTTFMCKWCGTWFCKECLRGAYVGVATETLKCRVCNQAKCQGTKVDFLLRPPPSAEDSGNKKGGKSASSAKSRSASPSKSAKVSKSSKSKGKKGGKKKAGKKKKK